LWGRFGGITLTTIWLWGAGGDRLHRPHGVATYDGVQSPFWLWQTHACRLPTGVKNGECKTVVTSLFDFELYLSG